MLRHKHIDRICCAVLALTVLIACLYMGAAAGGLITGDRAMGYEDKLFDQSCVHTIDIRMDDWDGFLAAAAQEEYAACTLVIDGERYANVAIRGKGNTSLTNVQQYGNNRYSFKVEFDHYQPTGSYHGLDKLSLNNIIQDNTYMKDYLAYTLMARLGVAAPLCSFVSITVEGEPFGLYLAVEGVEDSFLQRNYGNSHGELYKPDSMSFGGGRGNGAGFHMDSFMENFDVSQMENMKGQFRGQKGDRGGMGSMGADDVKLKYIDDEISSYTNIFSNAKTDVTENDQQRLIASLKALSQGDTAVVDADAVIRYLAVHDFLCNGDSYTGNMVHNYYLYEENGVLSMIPWDYNLAFGGFQSSSATATVNSPIDSPVSQGDVSDRPMVAWIFSSEETLAQYHAAYQTFVDETFASGWFEAEFDRVSAMIDPFVVSDPTAFCTYEEFQLGAETLRAFCLKRAESVAGQLNGTIPSTTEGQRSAANLVDASELSIAAMGNMGGMGRGQPMPGGFGGERGGFGGNMQQRGGNMPGGMQPGGNMPAIPSGMPQQGDMQPSGGDVPAMPGGMPQQGDLQQPGDNMPALPEDMVIPMGETDHESNATLLAACVMLLAAAVLITVRFKTYR